MGVERANPITADDDGQRSNQVLVCCCVFVHMGRKTETGSVHQYTNESNPGRSTPAELLAGLKCSRLLATEKRRKRSYNLTTCSSCSAGRHFKL